MPPFRALSAVASALALTLLVSVLTPATAGARPDSAGASGPPTGAPSPVADPFARGQAAIDRLGDRLPAAAQANGLGVAELRSLLLSDRTLAVDRHDQLAYFDVLAPGEETGPATGEPAAGTAEAPPTTGPEFQLASLPGAEKTIYLDFDGHVTENTTWNGAYGVQTIVSPPYDTNGNPDAWSSAELRVIRDSWAVAAEDFAPWNINVTTIEPPVDDLRYSGPGDTRWGARVVITADTFANCGCGGHAYIGSFDDPQDEPTFIYNSSFVGVSEAISHEVGHMLGLAHDGTTTGAAYYQGHSGPGETGWAPIMGVAYYQPVGQWSQQEYTGANNDGASANYNRGPDDIAIISSLTNGNGFGVRPDDHGDSAASATLLTTGAPSIGGIIETRTDVDVLAFTTSGGQVSLDAVGDAVSSNLDIALTLRDSSGAVVATANPASLLGATLTASVGAGTFTIEVDGVGVGDPTASPPTGYTDYGSLGRYTLSGTIDGVAPPDGEPPVTPTGLTASLSGTDVSLDWNDNTETDLANYLVQWSNTSPTGPWTTIATPIPSDHLDTSAPGGDNHYRVAARDTSGNVSPYTSPVTVTVPLSPEVATGDTSIHGSVSGTVTATHARDGVVQTITEVESGGKPSNRHDRAEHRWTIPASAGNQTLTVVASVAPTGDAGEGFVVEWSDDGAVWVPLTTVAAGSSVDADFAIGSPSGTIGVRVVDTDRTAGHRQPASISVDLLQVVGDGGPVDPDPEPTMAIADLTTGTQGAGQGRHYATATVTVRDDLGDPVAGASVDIRFEGDIAEVVTTTTGADGTAAAITVGSARKPVVTACVIDVRAGGLDYAPGAEAC